jgi:hypothetical protein
MSRAVLLTVLAALLVLPAGASALTVSKAELKGGQLVLQGTGAAPGIFVTVDSSASSAGARSDLSGAFKVQATNFGAADCTVIVSDRSTPNATTTLAGCTPKAVTPPPTTTPPPSGGCVINPGAPASYPAGDLATYFLTTTGCVGGPVQWTLVAGSIPPGMGSPIFQGQTAGAVTGRPTTEGTYTFTLKVTDAVGATDTETFTISVVAPRAVTITTPSALPAGSRGKPYQVNLSATGGLPGYLWTLQAGTLPGGMRLSTGSIASIAGTPTTRGTFSFTVRATDARGATGDRTFSMTIN